MYPYIRFYRNVLKAKRQPKLEHPFAESVIKMRTMPWDIDMFMEMNNGRYLTIMDTGRMVFGQRLGLLKVLKENNWGLMVAAVSTRFRYRLRPFTKFTLHTKFLYFEDKWFYFHQWFESENGKINASFLVKTAVISKKGIVSCEEVNNAMNYSEETQAKIEELNVRPEWVDKWEQSDAIHKEIMEAMKKD